MSEHRAQHWRRHRADWRTGTDPRRYPHRPDVTIVLEQVSHICRHECAWCIPDRLRDLADRIEAGQAPRTYTTLADMVTGYVQAFGELPLQHPQVADEADWWHETMVRAGLLADDQRAA